MRFGFWISFLDEIFLFILICAGTNLRFNFEFKSIGDAIYTIFSWTIGILLVLYTLFFEVFYARYGNWKLLLESDREFIKRYAGVIKDLDFKKSGRKVLLYPFAQQMRKLWLAYILVLGND